MTAPVQVRLCPGGPLLVRGATEIIDEGGNAVPVTRPVVAICRCAGSSRSPWCDGTHKVLRTRRPRTPDEPAP
ncbi:MAG: CDGSH iron-sulfur domain-containing protein [Sporichthyaceae bacterium]|nr:CDGSH iron-sulfur domain-containing protein [Sporichthyaceae bacterium]